MAGAKVSSIWSTTWRGLCGAILCYITAGLTSLIIGSLIFMIRDDFLVLKEIFSGLFGGMAGAAAGVWVLNHTLKRYPGRTIAWIYISILSLLLTFTLIGVIWILFDPTHTFKLKDYVPPTEIFQDFSGIGEAIGLFALLIQPKTNFMKQ